MGNKASIPEPKQVYLAAKAGNAFELQEIRRRAGDPSGDTPEARARLLEWTDDDGRTPLVVAAAKNHVRCVKLLLGYGANVRHVSRKREGGSALHEAVQKQCSMELVEALLSHHASPFVENSSGFTALDYAIVRKDLALVRRFEELGSFRGYMRSKVLAWGGLSRNWFPRWVSIVPRYSYPGLPANEQVIRRLLLFYENDQHVDPTCRVYLDGAHATIEAGGYADERVCQVMLHRTHLKPKGLYVRGNSSTGYTLFLKRQPNNLPSQQQQSNFPTLEAFVAIVNSQQAGTATPTTATATAGAPPGESEEDFTERLSYQFDTGMRLDEAEPGPTPRNNAVAYPTIMPAGMYPDPGAISQAPAQPVGQQALPYPMAHYQAPPQNAPAQQALPQQAPPYQTPTPQAPPAEVNPSAPPLPDAYIPYPAPTAPPAEKAAAVEPPAAELPATAPAAPSAPSTSPNDAYNDEDEDEICVICLDAPKEAGFVHGDSVHRCVCNNCANSIMQQEHPKCPVCRQRIETVLKKFY